MTTTTDDDRRKGLEREAILAEIERLTRVVETIQRLLTVEVSPLMYPALTKKRLGDSYFQSVSALRLLAERLHTKTY